MVKNEKNEELQSRREFFKKAAKGALPILGAVVLASAPGLANAAEFKYFYWFHNSIFSIKRKMNHISTDIYK